MRLYLHVPFCERKCGYCDFASWAGRSDLEPRWTEAVVREIALRAVECDEPLESVFFGGGTPSALSEGALESVCGAVRDAFAVPAGAEWTVECNPGSLTPPKLAILRSAGVTRLSLGVQSFDDRLLRVLGRVHDAATAAAALDLVAGSGLRWSADLMFALPGQDRAAFLAALGSLMAWGPRHVSFYGLTWEEGTEFWTRRSRGELLEQDDDEYAEMYEAGVEFLASRGIQRYEVSNFAARGEECRHNLGYWNGEDWLAAGNAAHGHRAGTRVMNPRGLTGYLDWAAQGFPSAGRGEEVLEPAERIVEACFLGLRQAAGFSLADLSVLGHRPDHARLARWESAGRIEVSDGRVRLAGAGWLLLDAIAADLAA